VYPPYVDAVKFVTVLLIIFFENPVPSLCGSSEISYSADHIFLKIVYPPYVDAVKFVTVLLIIFFENPVPSLCGSSEISYSAAHNFF
jgi:hypothetical protein